MPIGKVWIYRLLFVFCLFLFVSLFVCTVTDLSSQDKAISVKFCTEVHRRPRREISHFGELCSQKPKIGRIGARRVDVGSACVDNRQFLSLTALSIFIIIINIISSSSSSSYPVTP